MVVSMQTAHTAVQPASEASSTAARIRVVGHSDIQVHAASASTGPACSNENERSMQIATLLFAPKIIQVNRRSHKRGKDHRVEDPEN
jgi:hypothetical protein